MSDKKNTIYRIISQKPLYSKYEGICNVCKHPYYPGEQISPYFESDRNYFRHTNCLQLFYIRFRFPGECNSCNSLIETLDEGYWSKHNGIWCTPCGEGLRPKVSIAFSKSQERYIKKIKEFG